MSPQASKDFSLYPAIIQKHSYTNSNSGGGGGGISVADRR